MTLWFNWLDRLPLAVEVAAAWLLLVPLVLPDVLFSAPLALAEPLVLPELLPDVCVVVLVLLDEFD